MHSKDDYLSNLNRPLMMASNDDDDDDELFKDDEIGSGPLEDLESSSTSTTPNESEASGRNSKGITRNTMGFGVLSFIGIIPLVLLVLYMVNVGLSMSAMLFTAAFLIGLIMSIWTFSYYRKGTPNFSKFELHSFFSWPEIGVISLVLLTVSFLNLANLSSGEALRLSAESTMSIKDKKPEPIYAPEPPKNVGYEENEVLYQTKEFSPANGKKVTPVAPHRNKVRVNRNNNVAPKLHKNPYKRLVPVAVVAPIVAATVIKAHEDEEGTSTANKSINQSVDEAVNMANKSAKNYTPATAAKVIPTVKSNMKEEEANKVKMEVETSPFVSNVFLGGVLAAALGYALALALAGAILGLFRKFNNPFSAKVRELLNEETGEITLETESQTGVQKLLDYIFRFFVGFNIGGTVGFLLGLVITIPLYLLFWSKAQNEPLVANFLMTMGVVKNPDLAYATGMIVAGIVVPLVMLVVGKASPSGLSLSEADVRDVYSIPVTVNKVTAVSTIPEPAIISFTDMDDNSDREGVTVDEFSDDSKESITNELMSEFGVDLEDTFGMKVALSGKTNGNGNGKVSAFEKQKINSILENSLGELGNVTVQVSAELGKATIMLTDWLNLSEGMLIELDKPVSEEIDILINDVCKGKGKLTVVDNHLSVKVSKSNFAQSKN
ncbi:MAG: FliM/FliN family flagellar motor switch protein [Candidatus Sericytochromatia bacterium]|nr:FliM/FliN family flagellar motor switch protein [Candidatus Sericytochromatia bacterium]